MSDYIDAGLRRRRRAPLRFSGPPRRDEEDRYARFSLMLEQDAAEPDGSEQRRCEQRDHERTIRLRSTGRPDMDLAGVITDVTFECSACVTLVAYCELLCGRIEGLTPAEAIRSLQPQTLAAALPLVPALKRPRALLAAQALAAALMTAIQAHQEVSA